TAHPQDGSGTALIWEIPPNQPPYLQTTLPRALLAQLGQPAAPRTDLVVLTQRIADLFKERNIQLLIIMGWHNLLTAKHRTVIRHLTFLVEEFFEFALPSTHVLAMGDLSSLERIFVSRRDLTRLFYPLLPPDHLTEQFEFLQTAVKVS